MASGCLGDAVDSVAALRAGLAWPNLADPLQHADLEAALLQAGEEAADRIGLPARRLRNFGNSGALGPTQHAEHLLLLGALARLAPACRLAAAVELATQPALELGPTVNDWHQLVPSFGRQAEHDTVNPDLLAIPQAVDLL